MEDHVGDTVGIGAVSREPVIDPNGVMTSKERAEVLYEVREHRRKIDKLEEAVFTGNGHAPLMERATSLETEVDAIKKSVDDIKGDVHALRKGQNAIVWKILGGMAALLAVFVAAILGFVLARG